MENPVNIEEPVIEEVKGDGSCDSGVEDVDNVQPSDVPSRGDNILEAHHKHVENVVNDDDHEKNVLQEGETVSLNGVEGNKNVDVEENDELADEAVENGKVLENAEEKNDEWEDVLGSGRLQKKVLTVGEEEGVRPDRGSAVTVDVIERLEMDGDIVGEERGLQFNVGESEVMQGLDLAVPLMTKGETSLLRVDSSFAYGSRGNGSSIPGDSVLYLTVHLVSWLPSRPIPDIPLEERAGIGNRKRDRGNHWYSREDYSQAVQCYRKAVEYLDDEQIESDVEVPIDRFLLPPALQQLLEDRVKTCNNMAQAQMKLSAWDSALASVKQVLKIQPNNEKALFRKAKILQEKLQTEEAIGILRRISRLYPANKQCQVELTRMTALQRKSKEAELKMSKKMLGLDKEKDKSSSTSSRALSVGLAALGGMGAILGAYLAKHYNWY